MISLQTTQDLHNIISTNDATIIGILIAIVIVFATAIVYLYKNVQTLNKEYISELRASNEALIRVNNSYNEFVRNMIELRNGK
jgi:predicted Holliday junction resolvase-like endonuclease